jgi:hypothetical protein
MQSDAFEHGAPRVQVGMALVLVHPTAVSRAATPNAIPIVVRPTA